MIIVIYFFSHNLVLAGFVTGSLAIWDVPTQKLRHICKPDKEEVREGRISKCAYVLILLSSFVLLIFSFSSLPLIGWTSEDVHIWERSICIQLLL